MSVQWLAIWLVDWPIQRLRSAPRQTNASATQDEQAEPATAPTLTQPLVIWREDARRGRMVVAACEHCQAYGVRPLQPFHEATDLLLKAGYRSQAVTAVGQTTATFCSYRHDPLADQEALQQVAGKLQEISPLVAIEPAPQYSGFAFHEPQTLLLNVTGITQWFGGETALLQAASQLLASCGLEARLALASTSAAAWALAHFQRFKHHAEQAMSIAAAQTLMTLPTRALRLDEETAHQLDRLGLRTIGDVLELPRSGLATRLGNGLLQKIDEFTGAVPQPLRMCQPVIEEVSKCELEYPTEDRDILQHRLGLLVNELANVLSSRRRGALRLSCQFDQTQHPPVTLEVALFVPTAEADHLLRLLVSGLERQAFASMVQRITVAITLAGPLQQYQMTLFGDGSVSHLNGRRSLARLIETLSERLGRESVLEVEPNRNPLPEAAFQLRPIAGERRSRLAMQRSASATSKANKEHGLKSPRRSALLPELGPQASDALRRPLQMLTSPEAIEVLRLSAEGIPQQLRIRQRVYQVLRFWGPERIETNWWDGPQIRREYYRIETEDGSWWWIFHPLTASSPTLWKLHGLFA